VILLDIFINLLIAIAAVLFIKRTGLNKPKSKTSIIYPRQSLNILSFNDRVIKMLEGLEIKKTQSIDYVQKTNVRAIVVDDQIYWIAGNEFYTADVVDGNVEENTTRLVDTMTMDKVQLNKIMFIVDKLREGD
jgi:hypothetical protein